MPPCGAGAAEHDRAWVLAAGVGAAGAGAAGLGTPTGCPGGAAAGAGCGEAAGCWLLGTRSACATADASTVERAMHGSDNLGESLMSVSFAKRAGGRTTGRMGSRHARGRNVVRTRLVLHAV